jgi:hypothetical protein
MPGLPVNSQTGGVSPTPYSTTPGSQGTSPAFQQPGLNPQAQNAAAQMISQILTTPRPQGMPQGNPGMPAAVGGGIAGFASNSDGDAIMIYHDQTTYGNWEFVYDPTKWKPPPNPSSGTVGTAAAQLGSIPGSTPGSPAGTPLSNTQPAVQNPFGQAPFGQNPQGASPQTPGFGMGGGPDLRMGKQ